MLLTFLLLLLALVAPLSLAQQSQSTHQVLVGSDGLQFAPANISAAVGDKVEFIWTPPKEGGSNHSVTQSSVRRRSAAGGGKGE
jgi:plastocyanin